MRRVAELMDLHGRVALITGGAGHIGSAAAEALAELGAALVLLDSSPEACRQAAAEVQRSIGVDAVALPADLENEAAVAAVVDRVRSTVGRLDILVNCAALVGTSSLEGWAVPFSEQRPAAWRRALEVNLTAPFFLTQACVEMLASSGHGSVINVGSIYGVLGPDMRLYEGTNSGNPAAYAASKGGLLQVTRWLATALAPAIRVNAVSPGGVWRGQDDTFHCRYIERTPLRRMATEEDLKGAIAYLASDLSAYVTGHNLMVDGGWSAW